MVTNTIQAYKCIKQQISPIESICRSMSTNGQCRPIVNVV